MKCQSALEYVERLPRFQNLAKENITVTRAKQKYHADKKRRSIVLEKADLDMIISESLISFKNFSIPSKWKPKFLGQFSILEVMGSVAYKIELPPSMKLAHKVVHVSKLKKYIGPANESEQLSVL